MMTVAGFSSMYEDNPLAVWAAVGATVILAPLSTFLLGKAGKKAPPPFLSAAAWRDITLLDKRSESPSVRRLIFALPHKLQLLGLPAGQHVMVRVPKRGGGFWERPYNPTSTDAQPGTVEFLIKVYPNGEVSQALDRLQPGDKLGLKGPCGKFVYKPGKYKTIGLLAGGTGLTPMLRIIHTILSNAEDRVKLRLIYACNSPEELLMKKELDAFAAGYYGKFKVFYVCNSAPAEGHHLSLGVIDEDMLAKYLNAPPAPDVLTVRCGPAAFLADIAAILRETGYGECAAVELAEEEGYPL